MGGKTDSTLAKAMGLVIKKNREKKHPGHGGQARCAAEFGVSPSEWSRWERGVKTPSAANQRSIAEFFGIYIGELWGEEITAARSKEPASPFERGDEKGTPQSRDRYLEEGGDNYCIDHSGEGFASQDQSLDSIAAFLASLWPHNADVNNLLHFLRITDRAFKEKFGNTYLWLANDSRLSNRNTRLLFQLLLSWFPKGFHYDVLKCQRSEISRFISAVVESIGWLESKPGFRMDTRYILERFRDGLASFAWHKIAGETDYFFSGNERDVKGHQLPKDIETYTPFRIFCLSDAQMAKALQVMFGTGDNDPDRPAESPKERYQQHSLLSVFSMYKEILERLGHYIDDIERGTVPANEGKTVFLELLKLVYHRVEGDPAPEPVEDNGGVR